MCGATEESYFLAVNSAWYKFEGRILSPLDWDYVRAWFEAGIPLAAVLLGIETTLRNRRRGSPAGQVRSIAYCAPEVYDAWEEFTLAEIQTSGVKKALAKMEERKS